MITAGLAHPAAQQWAARSSTSALVATAPGSVGWGTDGKGNRLPVLGGVLTAEMEDDMTPLATVNGVPLHVAGKTNLYTVPAGKTCIPTLCVLRLTQAFPAVNMAFGLTRLSDGAAISPNAGGTSGGGINQNLQLSLSNSSAFPANDNVASGDIVQLDVTTPATGTGTADVDLFGYLV